MGQAVSFVNAAKGTGVPQKSEISRLFERLFGSMTLLHLKEFPDLHITAKASQSRNA
jgi:glycerol-3-phosphate dehydrogenase